MQSIHRTIMRIGLLAAPCLLGVMAFALTPLHAFAEDEVPLIPQHGIPLVIVYVNESPGDIEAAHTADPENVYGNIEAMNASENHKVRALGQVEIRLPQGYVGEFGSSAVTSGRMDLGYIRGRGNSTWIEPKKPYKIHFKTAQDLFGMGAAKNWALMANAMDDLLIRNRITAWLGNKIGLAYTPQMIPVDLVMVGLVKDEKGAEQEVSRDYLGSYCLSETVEIGPGRVDIDSLKKKDDSEPAITGGYLLAKYLAAQDKDKISPSSFFKTPSGLKITNDDPDFADEDLSAGRQAQRDYIRNYINNLDRLIMESEEITPDIHDQIAEKMDLDSLANYWWVQEFSYNTDAFDTGSTYMYKPRNGKLCWGPLWDFDIAWYVGIESQEGFAKGFNLTEMSWIDRLRDKDPEFVRILKEHWNDENGVRNALLKITEDTDSGILNRYTREVAASRGADSKRWPESYDAFLTNDNYSEGVERFRNYINKRLAWIDDNLDLIGNVYCTVTYLTDDGKVFKTYNIKANELSGRGPEGPDKPGYVFFGWKEKETGLDHLNYQLEGDTTFVPVYKKESNTKAPRGLFLPYYEDWVGFSPTEDEEMNYFFSGEVVVIPEDADVGEIRWTSSDESILYFDQNDSPVIKGVGDVDIKISLWNGLSKTLRLHVYDVNEGIEPVFPESIRVEPSSFTIRKGETIQVPINLRPEGKALKTLYYDFKPDDDSILDFHPLCNSVITGMKAGKVKVTVTGQDYDDTISLADSFEVTVVDDTAPISINNAKVCLSKKIFTYNGKVQKPVIQKVGVEILIGGTDYTYKWSNKSSRKVGTYKVSLTGKGMYRGKTKAYYKIVPRGTRLIKLKNKGRSVVVRWKRQSKKMPSKRITGYQLQFATDRKFTKNRKTLKIKGFKPVSKIVSGLKPKRKYYVRIRTYQLVRGVAYKSIWSPVKKVKTR